MRLWASVAINGEHKSALRNRLEKQLVSTTDN